MLGIGGSVHSDSMEESDISHAEYVRRVNEGRELPPGVRLESDAAVRYANGNPTILSLLYDMDLLPEQVQPGSYRWAQMLNIIIHFKAAIEAAEAAMCERGDD